MSYRKFKSVADWLLALVLLAMLSPFFLLILALVMIRVLKWNNLFFAQVRTGKNGETFKLYKLKTMRDDTSLKETERLTSLGKWLRKTSLDELPQLWNILKGDMSFVGPRPLLPEYLPLYSKKQNKRHEVKPGITGWAQVKGRNNLSWKQQFEMDVQYVELQSLWLDLKILLVTMWLIFKPKRGEVQLRGPFKGNDKTMNG